MWKNVFWLLLFYNNAVIATATQPSSYLSPIPIYLEGKLNEEIIGVVSRSKEILYRFVVNMVSSVFRISVTYKKLECVNLLNFTLFLVSDKGLCQPTSSYTS